MRDSHTPLPPWWRIVIAFMLTPLISALVLACAIPGFGGFENFPNSIILTTYNYALAGVYPISIIFGFPAFIILRKRVNASAANCALTGAMIAAAPVFLLEAFSRPQSAFVYGHAIVVRGAMTGWGLLYLMLNTAGAALFGAFGGTVFWVIAASGHDSSSRKS